MQQIEGRHDARALVDRWYSVAAGAWKQRPLAPRTHSEMRVLRDVLRGERFDVCVDMQGSVKSAVVGRMAGAAVFAGAARPRERVGALAVWAEAGCELGACGGAGMRAAGRGGL